jgi:hypothetical protein
VDWFVLFQDSVRWWAVVNTVMKCTCIQNGGFLDQLNDYQFLKNDIADWGQLGFIQTDFLNF